MLAALLTTVLFSISAVSAQRTTRVLGPTEANFWRILLATFFLACYAHGIGAGLRGVAFPVFLLSGLVGFGIGDLALYQAYPRLGSRLSIMLVHCLAAPFAAGVEWFWLGTSLTSTQILCSLVILAGVSFALAPSADPHLAPSALASGTAFGVLAALGQGMGAVISRKAYRVAAAAGEQIDGVSAAYQRIIGGVVIAGLMYYVVQRVRGRKNTVAEERSNSRPLGARLRSTGFWLPLNALAGPALGVSCYQWALATTPTGIVLPIVALTPLVIIPFAFVLEGERPTWRSLLGGAVAVAGVVGLTVS